MPRPNAYELDPYLASLTTYAQAARRDGERHYVVLADTILYPEGGGQPADRGTIGGVPVLDVQRAGDEIRHYVPAPLAAGAVEVELDWPRRFEHMQQHTGQHLLTAIAQDRLGWATTAFHLGERVSDVELDVPDIGRAELETLEDELAAAIRAALPVEAIRVPQEEFARMEVRTRGLPEGHTGDVRLVSIEGVDLNTCGGTHVRSTAELEVVKLLGTEPMRGGTRLTFVVGGRARRLLGAHEARNAELRRLLGAPDDELVPVLGQKLDQLKDALRRVRALDEELAAAAARDLAAQPGPVAAAHWPERDGGFLQRVAKEFVPLAPRKVALLTAPVNAPR